MEFPSLGALRTKPAAAEGLAVSGSRPCAPGEGASSRASLCPRPSLQALPRVLHRRPATAYGETDSPPCSLRPGWRSPSAAPAS